MFDKETERDNAEHRKIMAQYDLASEKRQLQLAEITRIEAQRESNMMFRQLTDRRASIRLSQVEGILLREWGYFRTEKDPLGKQDLNQLRQAFRAKFLASYGNDAPLLWLSNDVEVRAIVAASGSSWPKPTNIPKDNPLGITVRD